MGLIRIVWGTATAPTAMASYDAALAEANVHNYNLVCVSSVVPADGTIEAVGEAPDLGPAGERLTVVEGRATIAPGQADAAAAGLGWVREPDGPGLFYEAAGTDPDAVAGKLATGLDAGRELREWDFGDPSRRIVSEPADPDAYTTAIVLAIYGDSTPLL